MHGDDYTSCRNLAHPLLQITAAEQFFAYVDAFVKDEWVDLYKDEPPDEDEIAEAVAPLEMLGVLQTLGLRFDLASAPTTEGGIDTYWSRKIGGSTVDMLLHKWAYAVMDAVDIDARAFEQGLQATNLIFVQDEDAVVEKAYALYLEGIPARSTVLERYEVPSAQAMKNLRGEHREKTPEGESE